MSLKSVFRLFLLLLFAFPAFSFAAARRPELKPRPRSSQVPAEKPKENEQPVATEARPAGEWSQFSLFLLLNPDGEPQKVLEIFKTHPNLKATLIFPPDYFNDASRKPLISQFAVLQSSKQIEIALALDNEPNLALLADLHSSETAKKWGVDFSWPEDVAAQIARASGKYQKRWSSLPAGFFPPYVCLTEPVINTLKKFRMNWVIGKPAETWGVRFYGGTALLVPPLSPVVDETQTGKAWAEQMVEWSAKFPFVFIDGSANGDPKAEQYLLEILAKKVANKSWVLTPTTGQPFVEALHNEFELPKNATPFANDFSAWVVTSQQKRAWAALSEARTVIAAYQGSGHANLQRLDAAIEEMCTAESGQFLLDLGSQQKSANGPLSERPSGERNFLATIANIYRLCNAPVPTNLNTWFAVRSSQKTTTKTTINDGPFFVEGSQSLTWNDLKADDNGDGKYVPPLGNYPKGVFDFSDLTISWTDTDVTITAGVAESFAGKPTVIVPLVDVYVDVNRLTDAGSTSTLRRRGNTLVMREAAWEYAVTISPTAAVLFQAVPGGNPRILSTVNTVFRGKNFSGTFSRQLLRGDPKNWRISAGLMGTENNRRVEEPLPVSVLVNATEKSFGGSSGVQNSPFIDLLDSTAEDQTSRFEIHGRGGPLTLPYVESQ